MSLKNNFITTYVFVSLTMLLQPYSVRYNDMSVTNYANRAMTPFHDF